LLGGDPRQKAEGRAAQAPPVNPKAARLGMSSREKRRPIMTTTINKARGVISCLALLLVAQTASGRPGYVNLVPNASVFSCTTCHTPTGPPLNRFGSDFLSANITWSPTLAALDSDLDGFSNGQELGDPNGTGTPTPGATVTNPGDAASHPPPAATAPSITTQPVSQTVTAGADVSFTVAASGTTPLSYQWQKNTADISGATSATLSLNNVTAADTGNYRAVVSNAAGPVTSDTATLTVNTPATLTVSITDPADGATFAEPATFALAATAVPAGSVVSVEFFQGTASLGRLSTAPYAFTVVNLVAGNYSFTARATDNTGATATSAAIAITVTATPPPPPPNDAPVVTVTATDPNAAEVGPDPGTFRISRTGNTASPLTVNYLLGGTAVNGQDYQLLPTSVTIAAGSASADITVLPIAESDIPTELSDAVILELTSPSTGQTAYTVGSPSKATVTITEPPVPPPTGNQPPVVSLVTPRNGARFRAPARISLVAQASDPDGTIAKVEFFSGTTSLGVGTASARVDNESDGEGDGENGGQGRNGQYFLVWSRVPAGSYTLTAVATDNLGASSTSAPVKVTVSARRRHSSDD
jgi:hypothetical protein